MGINVLQARYISKLLNDGELDAVKGDLAVGLKVPPLEVSAMSGVRTTISYKEVGRPTLIYVFRPSCVWCQRNTRALKDLSQRLSDHYRIIGVSLTSEGLSPFVRSNGMAFPVYTGMSRSMIETYHLGATPESIVISPDGLVLGDWKGAYVGSTKAALERFFAMVLTASSPGTG